MNLATDIRWPAVRAGDLRAFALDSLAISVLALIGLLRHGVNPIERPIYAVGTIAPFVLGWIACTVLLGLYRNRRRIALVIHLRSVLVCWLAASNVAFLIRGSPISPGGVQWSFMLVMVGLGTVAVLGSRVAFESYVRANENRL